MIETIHNLPIKNYSQKAEPLVENTWRDDQLRRHHSRVFSTVVFVLCLAGIAAIFAILACLSVACN